MHKSFLVWVFFLTLFLSCACHETNCIKSKSMTLPVKTFTVVPTSTGLNDHKQIFSDRCFCIQDGKKCDCKPFPQFEAQVVAAASLLIIFGAALMLTGFMLFRVTIILTGVLLGSAIAWIGLQVNEPATSYPNTSTLYLGVCIGVGLVLGAFLMIFYRIGMYVLVGLAGILMTMFICCWKDNFVIQNFVHRSILAVSLVMLFILGLVFIEFITVVLSTSFIGAYVMILGVDLLVRTGFFIGLETLLDFNAERNRSSRYHLNQFMVKRFIPGEYHPDWKGQCMMGGVVALCIVSVLWQGWFNRGNRFGLNVIRNSNDTISKIK